jgi:MFS family permease
VPLGSSIYLVSALALAQWHDHAWQLFLVMAVAGLGSGCTFAAMPGLIVRFVPLAETGSAMAFNQVLRYLGFSAGSALAPVLLVVFSSAGTPTPRAFTAALLATTVIWVVNALGTLVLALKVRGPSNPAASTRLDDTGPL